MKFPLSTTRWSPGVGQDVKDATGCSILRVSNDPGKQLGRIVALANRAIEQEKVDEVTAALRGGFHGFVIAHVQGKKWRTLDSIGMPKWTTNINEALCFRLRKHADVFGADDPDDVRILEVEL